MKIGNFQLLIFRNIAGKINRRGISPVVASVLLIMIAVVTATLIAVFLIPFINERLGEGKGCFEILGDISFHETQYNCFSGVYNVTGFSVNMNNERISGFTLIALIGGTSDRIVVTDNSTNNKLKMLGTGSFGEILEIPDQGGVRTYVYNGTVDALEIYPILDDGAQCDKNDEFEPHLCTSIEVANCLNDGTDC